MEEVLDLISDSRLLAAKKLYDIITQSPEKCIEYADMIMANEKKLSTMVERCGHVTNAMSLVAAENPNWILAANYLGVTTHYMLGDDGLLWVRMEATQCDIPVMEQMAVVYEVEWFKLWIPFCSDSRLIARVSHTELVAYTCISAPFGISRECVVYAYGVDCMYENGSLVVLGKSVEEYDGVGIPPCKGFFNKRATLEFSAVVTPFSPTSGHMIVVAKVNPKLSLPQSILNFVTKQLAGFFLVMIYQQAREIANNDASPYRAFIQANRGFYIQWLLPRMRAYFDHQGWLQPVIRCLGEDGFPDSHPDKTGASCNGALATVDTDRPNETGDPSLCGTPSDFMGVSAASDNMSGRLLKRGSTLFYSVWSHRYFELDKEEQLLRWFKCGGGGEDDRGAKRGEISLKRATAVLTCPKNSVERKSGVQFVVSYYGGNKGSMPRDMFLSAPNVAIAYKWIAHVNRTGQSHEISEEVFEAERDIAEEVKRNDLDICDDADRQVEESGVGCGTTGSQLDWSQAVLIEKVNASVDVLGMCCGVIVQIGKVVLFIAWFMCPLYPLLLSDAPRQQMAYILILYGAYILPATYKTIMSPKYADSN